ncbi:MAG: glycosyltransferase family 4 protein [bacterium]
MRIVHLNPFYFPFAGGIERRIRSITQRLAAQGHDVHIVTAQLEGTAAGIEKEGAVTVHRLPSSFPLQRFYNPPPVRTKGVAAYVNALAPDVVDFHFRWSPSWNKAFREISCPGVITYHNTYGEGKGILGLASKVNDRMYMRTLRAARRVVCVSDRVRRDLVQHGFPAEPLRLNYNAVELDEIKRIEGRPATSLPHPFAVAVGRLVALKGFDVLIDAWRDVPEPFDLVLVGRGPMLEAWKKRAQRLGIAHRVKFPGWVSEEEKVRLLKAADVYVHPARFESFPFSLLEAMAAGAPLVCSDVGGIPEAVGDAGPLLGHDPKDWAREVGKVAADVALRGKMSKASAARLDLFNWDRITAELLEIYGDAARRDHPS